MGLVVQRVDLPGGEVSWTALDGDYAVVGPVDRFLAHLRSVDRSPTTVRSYAFDLRDLFGFLAQVEVAWDAVRLEDLGRFMGWLRQSPAERAGNVARLRDRTGVRFTPHLFRHTYATDLLRRQVPSEVVQKLLGHASVSTTIDTYAHLEIEHIRAALRTAGWLPEAAAAHETGAAR